MHWQIKATVFGFFWQVLNIAVSNGTWGSSHSELLDEGPQTSWLHTYNFSVHITLLSLDVVWKLFFPHASWTKMIIAHGMKGKKPNYLAKLWVCLTVSIDVYCISAFAKGVSTIFSKQHQLCIINSILEFYTRCQLNIDSNLFYINHQWKVGLSLKKVWP